MPGEGAQQLAGARALDAHQGHDLALLDAKVRRRRTCRRDAVQPATLNSRPPAVAAAWPAAAFRDRLAPLAEDELLGDGRPRSAPRPPDPRVTRPSRMTATRAACSTRSPRRWVTRMTMRPASASSRISRKSSSDSSSVSAEFGSSKRKTRASRASARAISVRCWVASEQSPSGRSARWRDAERVHQLAVVGAPRRGRRRLPPSRPTIMFSATRQIGEELRLLVHDRDRRRQHRRGDQRPPSRVSSPASAGLLAGEDAHQRALAGAVRSGDAEDLARARGRGRARRARWCCRSACAGPRMADACRQRRRSCRVALLRAAW